MTSVGKPHPWSKGVVHMVCNNQMIFSKAHLNTWVTWLANLACWELSYYAVIHISPNFWIKDRIFLFPFSKNCQHWLKSLLEVMRLFSRSMEVLAVLAHKPFCRKENFPPLNMAHTLWNMVMNFHLTWSFCWRVPGTVYSNSIPIPSTMQAP